MQSRYWDKSSDGHYVPEGSIDTECACKCPMGVRGSGRANAARRRAPCLLMLELGLCKARGGGRTSIGLATVDGRWSREYMIIHFLMVGVVHVSRI